MLDCAVAGHDVDSPSTLGDVVKRCTVFGDVERVKWPVEHVHCADEQDARCHGCHSTQGYEGVEGCFTIVATFWEPLRATKGEPKDRASALIVWMEVRDHLFTHL